MIDVFTSSALLLSFRSSFSAFLFFLFYYDWQWLFSIIFKKQLKLCTIRFFSSSPYVTTRMWSSRTSPRWKWTGPITATRTLTRQWLTLRKESNTTKVHTRPLNLGLTGRLLLRFLSQESIGFNLSCLLLSDSHLNSFSCVCSNVNL